MRILFAVLPQRSTFLYLVPMAWALRTAGHEVIVASAPDFAATITEAGLTAAPVGRTVSEEQSLRARGVTADVVEKYRAGLPPPYDVAEDPAAASWTRLLHDTAGALEGLKYDNFGMQAGLVDFACSWQPDLVVWHPWTVSGPIAAKACGAAHARMLFSVDVFAVVRERFTDLMAEQPERARFDPFEDWYAGYGRRYGFEFSQDMVDGNFTIDPLPPSLRLPGRSVEYVPTRYVPYGGRASVPTWVTTTPTRPRVALTLGSTATTVYGGYTVELRDLLTALAELDIELVATVAESEQARLGDLPDNVRVVPYVPWHALAPTCSAVIHHAGAATMATTARYGVPQLALPYHFDQPILGRLLARQGAGLTLSAGEATGSAVRDGVQRLLDEPVFTEQAGRLRDEMLEMPTPNDVVDRIEELTVRHRTRSSVRRPTSRTETPDRPALSDAG